MNAWTRAKSFWSEENGPTATEYAVMLALIITICILAIRMLGTKVSAVYQDATNNW